MLWPDSLYDAAAREAVLARIAALRPDARRVWGKMDLPQAMAHCAVALEAATGDRPMPQAFIGKILGSFFRGKLLGPEPFDRDSPTHKDLKVADRREFARERDRLAAAVKKFAAAGPDSSARIKHGFIGRLTGDEWGRVMHKHLDHHLKQFGA
jgi:murein endopeptidase